MASLVSDSPPLARRETSRPAIESLMAPIVGGLLVMLLLLGLIGTAIRDPRPHDIPVGVVGPAPAVQQITGAFGAKAPGTFAFMTYDSEDSARAALDARDVDGVLVLGAGAPRLLVAGAAGDGISAAIMGAFSAVFAAQGVQLTVAVTHPFASGDAHGLILFFLVLATLISTLVATILLFVRGRALGVAAWVGVLAGWSIVSGVAGVGAAAWIVGGYDLTAAVAMMGLIALASFAVGAFIAGCARLLGPPGFGLAALIVVLLDLVSSGGPVGSSFLPDFYRWLAPWMPAGELFGALRGVLYFDGAGVTAPIVVMAGWAVVGLVLLAAAAFMPGRSRTPAMAG